MQEAAAGTSAEAETALVRQLARPVVVMVGRRLSGWVAEVAALGVQREACSLVGLGRRIRALLGTAAIDYQFHTADAELDRLIRRIRAAREAVRCSDERAQRLTEQALRTPSGGTVRDLGFLLGVSYQRAHQLLQRQAAQRLSTVEDERRHETANGWDHGPGPDRARFPPGHGFSDGTSL
jgi:hypothetical protein